MYSLEIYGINPTTHAMPQMVCYLMFKSPGLPGGAEKHLSLVEVQAFLRQEEVTDDSR
jgi:hypothetical protein